MEENGGKLGGGGMGGRWGIMNKSRWKMYKQLPEWEENGGNLEKKGGKWGELREKWGAIPNFPSAISPIFPGGRRPSPQYPLKS